MTRHYLRLVRHALSHLLVRALLPEGVALTAAVDDTLFKRYGKKVFGAGW
jgi:hypothetical protein